MDRAYSLLEIKSVDAEQRIIEGFASTPDIDRGGDSMDPAGAQYTLPLPFLWFHNDVDPIGEVFWADIQPEGIYIKAKVSKVDTPGRFKTLVDEAWAAFTAKPPLVRGLSIGWKELASVPIKGGFRRVVKWFWGELSAVTIPMNTAASIRSVKSHDTGASALITPGVTGKYPIVRAVKGAKPMTIQEQIAQFQTTRGAEAAIRDGLMTKAAETGESLDQEQSDAYDEADRKVKSIDVHLARLRDLEKSNIATATPITPVTTPQAAAELRAGHVPIITVKSNLPKGTAFTRMCMSMASAKGDSYQAMERAKSWKDTPEVELMTKAAIAAGTTTDATWAGPLAAVQPLVNEFLELLRPRTLLGRIPGLKNVPFNISVSSQTTGGTYNWVGQGLAKPVTKADYATVSLPFAKAAGIIVLTEELVKLSTPSAENLVREEMIAGMGQFLDGQFQDPAVAAVANVNPASITNGAATNASFGVTGAFARQDLVRAVSTFTAAGIPLEGSVWIMNDSNAFALGTAFNALGQPMFPGVSLAGGTLMGMPVIVSNSVSTRLILVHAPSILFADDGGVSIDVSREASIQMDSAPTNPTDATTVLVSLWQRNLVGLKAERYITWIRARTAAVHYTTAVAYTGA